jgi:hypothetical protein
MHFVKGFLNEDTIKESVRAREELVEWARGGKTRVHLDTIISPSFTSAIAQCVQLPGLSGKGNNLFLMEYAPSHLENRDQLLENLKFFKAVDLDLVLLRSSGRSFGNRHDIHLWITPEDKGNASLMILLSYIIQGHPDWSEASISVFFIYDGSNDQHATELSTQILEGRIPISEQNIELIKVNSQKEKIDSINQRSGGADLVVLGFHFDSSDADEFEQYDGLGETMFVYAKEPKIIQ